MTFTTCCACTACQAGRKLKRRKIVENPLLAGRVRGPWIGEPAGAPARELWCSKRTGIKKNEFNQEVRMVRRLVPRRPDRRHGPEKEDFGERYGNNYGYGREGEHVEPFGPRTEGTQFVDRYAEPYYPLPEVERGPYAGVGPKGYRRSDNRIREDVCERLTHHGRIDARAIALEVRDGEVILKGSVKNRKTKRMAEDVALTVSGVRDVRNQLRLVDLNS
jgi:hypothetical protein